MRETNEQSPHEEFEQTIQQKARRKQRAHREAGSIWFGLGTFGMVGWSVAIPTLLGALAGGWLEVHFPVDFSWRLTLLLTGLIIGCTNAWYWVSKERRHAQEERERYEHD